MDLGRDAKSGIINISRGSASPFTCEWTIPAAYIISASMIKGEVLGCKPVITVGQMRGKACKKLTTEPTCAVFLVERAASFGSEVGAGP